MKKIYTSINLSLKAITATFIFCSFLFALTSCETITEIDLPVEDSKLVVNAVFNADSLVKVDLSESQSVNTNGFRFTAVENASIEVFKNATSLGFLNYKGKGLYFSAAPLPNDPGAEYKLKVVATGFETAEATEVLPEEPVIGELQMIPTSQNNASYKAYKGKFTLTDAPEENYYLMRIWIVEKDRKNSRSLIYFGLKNTLGQFELNGMISRGVYLFDDKSFNGKSIELEFDFTQGFYTNDATKYEVMFELVNTGKAYYNYQFDVHKQSGGNSVFNPEKSPVSNNIKNGLGIYAPYNSAALIYDFQ